MEKNRQGKGKIWRIMGILCGAGAVICVVLAVMGSMRQKERAEEMSRLAQEEEPGVTESGSVGEPREETAGSVEAAAAPEELTDSGAFAASVRALEEAGIPVPEGKAVDLPGLREEENGDIYAWIYIPDTQIDYPVLQHPEDDRYYLDYNIDGSKGYPGCIYSERAYNSRDFTDANTVLYGHNMKNGSMFAGLHKYEDSEYFEGHPYVYIYTERKLLVYRIFAAYVHGNEHLLYSYDFGDPEVFKRYFEEVRGERGMNSNFREDVELSGEEHILTLSTCIANRPDNRYLVQGVLMNED